MTLKTYRKKRNFKKTKEPAHGKKEKSESALFVVQKHNARHLHYDFRLELNGALKSWAVPKGPSLDPSVKRLAVHVEDHPIAYGSFEGTIPKGQYGAGTVKIWDTGTWECLDGKPLKQYKAGSLTFILKGKKLHGEWKLIQFKNDPKNWLLIKVRDRAKHSTRSKSKTTSPDTKEKAPPGLISPQLATLVKYIPSGSEWIHELKYDGYRLIIYKIQKTVKIITRNGNDWTNRFPNLAKAIAKIPVKNFILDGELIALNKKDEVSFQALQQAIMDGKAAKLIFYAFDLLYLNNQSLLQHPLLDRKQRLAALLKKVTSPYLQLCDYKTGDGNVLLQKACQDKFEGIVSKNIESPYEQRRSKSWLKTKCKKRQEFIIGGFTKPQGSRKYFGSLLIGYFDKKKFIYCGHVGTGFTAAVLKTIYLNLKKYITSKSAFNVIPPLNESIIWVLPKLVCEVEFNEWTEDGNLRHACFKGLRFDKDPFAISKEEPMMMKKSLAKKKLQENFNITHPEKLLYPEEKITKQDVANYYQQVSELILPFVSNRPLSVLRCPDGYKKCFYQKHITDNLPGLLQVLIDKKSYPYIKDSKGLLSLSQLGILELHCWGCHVDKIERPDVIVFDLDPGPDVSWKRVINAAYSLQESLKSVNLVSFVKTTGGKGLHVVVPIKRNYSWDDIKHFSQSVVDVFVSQSPKEYIGRMSKAERQGKIFIDYLRNQRTATAVAPYSLRANEKAAVAMPLEWKDLATCKNSQIFTIKNALAHIEKRKRDPWEDYCDLKQSIIT